MARKKRAESFFGMHFDFHAQKNQQGIGSNSNPEAISEMLERVKPDYIQCDTKGHAGASSYPTKVGYAASGIHSDVLRMFRKITKKYDVSLYAHHSGVWDNLALEHNPSWGAVNDKGELSQEKNSVFGPYAEKLLSPQLIEMALDYDLDGAWIDGECWAVIPDYSEFALKAWEAKTGEKYAPLPGEDRYDAYLEFNREGFRQYLRHYIETVKSAAPEFQIASNWMYTSFVPEEVTLPVDFISGDYSPSDSVNTARFEGYSLINQPQPWDLMAWGFNIQNGYHCVKTCEQLCQEAAVVISIGGGFQFYNRQVIGTVQEWAIPMWEELATFCRARQELCHRAKPVPQVGIIHSTKAFYEGKTNLFTAYGCKVTNSMKGLLFSVLDNQYSAEILMTHHIREKSLDSYGILCVPNITVIEDEVRESLINYVINGGILLLAGEHSSGLFEKELDLKCISLSKEPELLQAEASTILPNEEGCIFKAYAPFKGKLRNIIVNSSEVLSYGYRGADIIKGNEKIFAVSQKLGKGKIIGIMFDLGTAYNDAKSVVLRDFTGGILEHFESPKARVYNSHLVQIALMEKEGEVRLNLLNLSGAHSDEKQRSFDEIPSIYNLRVEMELETKPERIVVLPNDVNLEFDYKEGKAHFNLPQLDIHAVIVPKY